MINDDILIKYSIKHGFGRYTDWVSHVKYLSSQIRDIRDHDFTGIGANDLSLISPRDVKAGMRIILSDTLDQNGGPIDTANILGLITRVNPENPNIVELEIEGLGSRPDFSRDPSRTLRWGSKIYPDLRNYPCLLEMITKPKSDGGAVYYYYNKSPRDLRVNFLPGQPEFSRQAILGCLRNTSYEDLENLRHRSQYMHTYRRVAKEISEYLREVPGDTYLEELREIIRGATKETSNLISGKIWEKLNIAKS